MHSQWHCCHRTRNWIQINPNRKDKILNNPLEHDPGWGAIFSSSLGNASFYLDTLLVCVLFRVLRKYTRTSEDKPTHSQIYGKGFDNNSQSCLDRSSTFLSIKLSTIRMVQERSLIVLDVLQKCTTVVCSNLMQFCL